MDEQGDKGAFALDNTIPCATWDLVADPVRLPSIPELPDLMDGVNHNKNSKTQLIQVAGLDGHIIGLTNRGQVLKFDCLYSEETVPRGRWEYVRLQIMDQEW